MPGANRFSDEHPYIFHYTTIDAFQNIIKTDTLWASHYKTMNDLSEFSRFDRYAKAFLSDQIREYFSDRAKSDTEFLTRIINNGGIERTVDEASSLFLHIIHSNTFGEKGFEDFFIASFCYHCPDTYEAENGLLSQWRGYGADGGVAIELSSLEVEKLLCIERQHFAHSVNHIGDVKYDAPENGDVIHDEFGDLFRYLERFLASQYKNTPIGEWLDLLPKYIDATSRVKHRSFHEEREARIVIAPIPTNPKSTFHSTPTAVKPIKFRKKGNEETSYIELFGNQLLPITKVIVGPSRFQNTNYQIVRDCLKDRQITVIKSETPFRA